MKLNKVILRKYIKDEKTIIRILRKATQLDGMKHTEEMTKSESGKLYFMVHFNKEEWIEAQKEHIKVMRRDSVPTNTKLLKIVEGIR